MSKWNIIRLLDLPSFKRYTWWVQGYLNVLVYLMKNWEEMIDRSEFCSNHVKGLRYRNVSKFVVTLFWFIDVMMHKVNFATRKYKKSCIFRFLTWVPLQVGNPNPLMLLLLMTELNVSMAFWIYMHLNTGMQILYRELLGTLMHVVRAMMVFWYKIT